MAEQDMITDTMGYEDLMFDSPIPGQSLTQDPDNPMPYERPPEFTDFQKAQEYLFDMMMDMGPQILEQLTANIPVSFIGPQFCVLGAANGKWNPDLMLLLIEPSIYTVLFIAEQAGVDYIMDFDEEFEHLPPETRLKAENHIQKAIKKVNMKIEGERESADIADLMPPSLLARAEGE